MHEPRHLYVGNVWRSTVAAAANLHKGYVLIHTQVGSLRYEVNLNNALVCVLLYKCMCAFPPRDIATWYKYAAYSQASNVVSSCS